MEMFAAIITAIVVLIVCNIAHSRVIKEYEKEIQRCRDESSVWMNRYFDIVRIGLDSIEKDKKQE